MPIISKGFKAILLLGLFSMSLLADVESAIVKIKALRVMNDGRVLFWVTGNTPCATDGYSINISGTNGQQMYQASLSAYNTGAPVRIYVDVADSTCQWGETILSLKLEED
jgi:hypothetical protein